jgi:hypothetical protein
MEMISGLGAGPARMLERAQKAAEAAPQQMQEFEEALRLVEQQGQDPSALVRQSSEQPPAVAAMASAEATGAQQKPYVEALETVKAPDGPAKLIEQVERGSRRLEEIISSLQGGKTFTPQQLIGLQGEMHQITIQLEAAVKVAGDLTNSVKTILQQQA